MPPLRGGLGRGLSALIPEAKPAGDDPPSGLIEVAPGQIRPNPRQPRQRFEETALQELAASIVEHGLLQPLIVAPLPASEAGIPEFQLIAGERRWQAAKLAQLPRVPVIVKQVTPQQSLEMALIENIQRADLNPLEEAAAYQQLQQEHSLTHEEIARRVGKSRVTITNSLRLLGLPREARRLLLEGEISEGHARALLSLPSDAIRLELLRLILERHLSVRHTEDAARRMQAAPTNGSSHAPEPDVQSVALERDLQAMLSTKVSLSRTAKGGKLTIYFYSDEELHGLVGRLKG